MNGVFLSSVLMRREKLKRAGGVEVDLDLAADYGIWFKLCFEGKAGYIPDVLAAYRIHDRQATRNFIPGLKLRLVEYFISNAKKRGIETGKFEEELLLKSIMRSFRELPRYRIESASAAMIWKRFTFLRDKYREKLRFFSGALSFLIALLPRFLLKAARVLYLKGVHTRETSL